MGVVDLYQGVGEWVLSHSCFFYLYYYLLFSHVLCLFFKSLEHDSCYISFYVYYLFFVSGPFNQELLVHRNCCV